jgi:nucleotide-binding universal stress UspA family protein
MPKIERILVPVVFSARCEQAAGYAASLARKFDADLTVLHVFVPTWMTIAAPEVYVPPPQVEIESSIERLRRQLDDFLPEVLRGLRVRREVRQGDPPRVIAELVRGGEYDLIVMPTHGYGPFRKFLLGSVTAKVLHDTACPVLTGPHMEHPPEVGSPAFRRVLCALDFGPQTRAILEWGSWLAGQFAAELTLIHALPAGAPRLGGIYFDPQWRADMAADARTRIDGLLGELHIKGGVSIEAGDVPAVVRESAESAGADLLVIGRGHHHGLLGRLRTNAYAILRESPCPVVAI